MKRIALITGASRGLGRALAAAAAAALPELEELWLVSRNITVTEELAAACGGRPLRPICLDLCQPASFAALREQLQEAEADIRLLVNNAGCGFLSDVADSPARWIAAMTDLNTRALSLVTHLALPHMAAGSHIINVASIASFCPTPRMTVYSATKAYVTAFSRGLREELRPRGITVTAVCPGPMDTEFLDIGGIRGNSKTFSTLPYCRPERVARGALRAALRDRAVYTPQGFYKLYRVLAKLLPQAWVVRIAAT